MKKIIMAILFAASVATIYAAEKKPLTNADVVKLVKAELPESTVILAIQNSSPAFNTSPEDLIALKTGGVSPAIIDAMLSSRAPPSDVLPEPPSEGETEQILKRLAREQSEGVITIAAFKKTNGQRLIQNGVHLYKIEFEALVRFSEDCIWLHINIDTALKFRVARRSKTKSGGGWDEFMYISQNPGLQVKRGSVFLVKGLIQLDQRENGWNPVFLAHSGIEMSSAEAIIRIQGEKNSTQARAARSITRDDLAKLCETTVAATETPDQSFTSKNGKVTASCPAGFKIERGDTEIVGRFVAPDGGASPDAITITCASTPLLNRNQTLDGAVKNTIASIRSEYPGAVLTEVVITKLAGVDAETFAMTTVEKGNVIRRAVTVAVCKKHVLGAVLHSTPENFAETWKQYKRVCDSYALTVK